ncbi:unnamed protein product [Alopecurus aequalis]
MANFPFDPTPFLPPDRVALEVEGRPARVRVIHGDLRLSNEDLAIITIIPMPQGEVAFQNVQEILGEFFTEKRVAIKSISKCPFGQAFVRFDSVEDRDWFVGNGPHVCDDVHLVFQKHNEGINWRKFNLNREVLIQIIGFPADLRCMHELANAVKSFAKLLIWDRTKSTDAYVLVKIGVTALSNIPTSTVVSGADRFSGESWTCPVVILQDYLLGGGPLESEEVPVDGVPHPMPQEQFHHPNQNNLMIGPIPAHEENDAPVDNVPLVGNQVINHPIHMAIEEQLTENVVAWDHWAMQPATDMVDMELHAGEFLELNDLMGPAVEVAAAEENEDDIGSDLTLTINLPGEDDSSDNSIQGPPVPNAQMIAPLLPHHFLDLNIPVVDIAKPLVGHELAYPNIVDAPALDLFPFPVLEEVQGAGNDADILAIQNHVIVPSAIHDPTEAHMSELVLSTEINNNVINASIVAPMTDFIDFSHDTVDSVKLPSGSDAMDMFPELVAKDAAIHVDETQKNVPDTAIASDTGISVTDKTHELEHMGTEVAIVSDVHSEESDADVGVLGEEGAFLWKKHFAPQSDNDKITKVPIEWMNFFTAALLSQEKVAWAKSFLATQLWKYIVEGIDASSLRPFVISDVCPVSQDSMCAENDVELEQTTLDKTIYGSAGTATTSAIHAHRKRKEKAPLVETEVRRSTRLQQLQKGFKKTTCMNKQCISCSARPPVILAKIVRNLGVSFYKVDPSDCSEEELHKKEKKKKKVQKELPRL